MLQTIAALMKKELLQIRRDRIMLRLIFIMPLVQLLILGYAVSTDVKLIDTAVYDFDRRALSREFARSFGAGDYFLPRSSAIPLLHAEEGFKENRFSTVMIIPDDFSEDMERYGSSRIGLVIDGTNANSASISLGYAGIITAQFNRRLAGTIPPVSIRQKVLYNPEAESVYFMVPGIIAVLLTMVTVMLTAMAIVREREIGTLEQLVVTPIRTPALILGKTIPFAILGFLEISIALAFGVFWFHIPFAGSWALLYALSFIYLFTTLGVGMFISTATKTQQQAMFFSWFFSIFTILTSGFFIPIANMPMVVQYLTFINPLRYYMKIVRAIMMKGASVDVLYAEIAAMILFGLVVFSFSWMRFSKRVK